MVAVRDIHLKDNFTLDEWVSSLTLSESDKNQLRTVYQYCLTLGDEALTNRLLVRDNRAALEALQHWVAQIDLPVAQVELAAHIVSMSEKSLRELGVKWNLS